ncbi:hypothetical protein BGZ68_000147 [Mortierella alpina]|nr:hypothetical protein BGZ68_000147 [Mortierella alpina]
MPKRLSIFCPCLPRKQRDNLSSRALYHDQDSSSGLDDYSGDEDDYYHDRYRNNPASRLEALRPSTVKDSSSTTTTTHNNPWPSSFSNGRFSRPANHHQLQHQQRHSNSLGSRGSGGSQRKPNPFRPYRDDTSSDEDEDENKVCDRVKRPSSSSSSSSSSRTRNPIFKPYRDDDESDEDVKEARPRRMRTPRNPQGQMAWQDDENEDEEDKDKRGQGSADADAEEVIDVDALIAEQERITRELAAQEDALRKEEEDLIHKKKLAAIHAAEKRGLLRFEGGQLIIPSSGDNHKSNYSSNTSPHSTISEQRHNIQHESDARNLSGRPVSMERTTSSAASSYVGGIDAFDQELKLMSLDVQNSNHRKEKRTAESRSSASTPTLSTTSPAARSPVMVRTVSTGVSTSTSTSAASPTLNINPRGVLNNITSFLKKVDGVIAGESSDEASCSDQEQHLDKKPYQRTDEPGIVKKAPQGMTPFNSSGSRQSAGGYSTSAAEGEQPNKRTVVAVSTDPQEQPNPPHHTLTSDHSDDTIIYPTDVFNGPSETMIGSVSPTGSSSTLGSRANNMKQPMNGQDPSAATSPPPPPPPRPPTVSQPQQPAASERIYDTFTSFFNSGSSFMGLFGTGHRPEDDHDDDDDERHGHDGDDDDSSSIDDYDF